LISAIDILALVCAYLLGSIPASVWIGQVFYGVDVREYGSGNAGATNTFRVLGKKAGIPVLIFDVFKGWMAVKFAFFYGNTNPETTQFINAQIALGLAALMGHIFPVYVGFRGGKGIATLLGIMIGVLPWPALCSIGVFIIVLLISKYVSLSSMVAAIAFPIIAIGFFDIKTSSLAIFSLFIAIIVLVTHQKNIERLLRREESKTNLYKKKSTVLNEEDYDENDD
jgi:acyl phosphate:glycerol-3-phosphate acyltransferase